MILSNHKRLVNGCYPSSLKDHKSLQSKSAFEPDSNSISKLIYYCSTRPNKIVKVTSYLLSLARLQTLPQSFSSTVSIYRNSKPGLICTIKIFNQLLTQCHKNLHLFALNLINLLILTLDSLNHHHYHQKLQIIFHHQQTWISNDLDIKFESIKLFSNLAIKIQSDCLNHQIFIKSYLYLLNRFSSILSIDPSTLTIPSNQSNHSVNQTHRYLSFVALESSLHCPGLSSHSNFEKQIQIILPGLLACIFPNKDRNSNIISNLIHQSDLDSSPNQNQIVNQLITTRSKILSSQTISNLSFNENDLIIYSIKSLNFLFTDLITNLTQFSFCLNLILNQIDLIHPIESADWFNWLGSCLLNWSSKNYKSFFIDLLVDQLVSIFSKWQKSKQDQNNSNLDSLDFQPLYQKINLISGLLIFVLTNPIANTIQLLNITKITHKIIRLVQSIIRLDQLDKRIAESINILVKVIGSLALNIYYDEQINDMCRDLLDHVISFIHPPNCSNQSEIVSSNHFESYDLQFIIFLFNCLDLIIINSHKSHPNLSSSSPSTRPNHLISITQWKNSVSVLEHLTEHDTRSAFFKALSSFIKFEAFQTQQTFKPGVDQQLVQLLSAINLAVFQFKTGLLNDDPSSRSSRKNNPCSNLPPLIHVVPSDVIPKAQNEHSSSTTIPQQSPSSKSQKNRNQTSRACQNSAMSGADQVALCDCMVEIMSHKRYQVLLICLPMLQELDKVMKSRLATSNFTENQPRSFKNSQTNNLDDCNQDVVVACLKKIGKVWEIETLECAIIKVGQTNASFQAQQEVDWDIALGAICRSEVVQKDSGMSQARLQAHFNEQSWSPEEARRLANWSINRPSRRASIISNLARNQLSSIALSRASTTNNSVRLSFQPSTNSHRSQGVESRQGFNENTWHSTSVSDLKRSLLGIGARSRRSLSFSENGSFCRVDSLHFKSISGLTLGGNNSVNDVVRIKSTSKLETTLEDFKGEKDSHHRHKQHKTLSKSDLHQIARRARSIKKVSAADVLPKLEKFNFHNGNEPNYKSKLESLSAAMIPLSLNENSNKILIPPCDDM
ncbi:hypothetical protein O181_032100 [Austropuccinia psidii MF-1]|uniref:Uncharacterized protein n=1 Tax=Austropuccinia psidii MF-1 TaxID=1389203 RepID=A0A9Q3H7W6_9BASI|nr:hypothetical protein [Austropuccinia psidii MF-1]